MDEDNQARLRAAAAIPPPAVFAVLNDEGCIDAVIGDKSRTHHFSVFVSLAQLVKRKSTTSSLRHADGERGTGRGIMLTGWRKNKGRQ